jgi:hypothetical protein
MRNANKVFDRYEIMKAALSMTCLRFFRRNRNLSDEVNSNIVQSEIEGGVNLQNLRAGSALQIHTQHTSYNVLVLFGSLAFISGHPLYYPRPVLVDDPRRNMGRFHAQGPECTQSSMSQIAVPGWISVE